VAVARRLTPIVIFLSCASFLRNVWDSASNNTMQLPMLLPTLRFSVLALFVGMCALGLAALGFGRRAWLRRAAYSIEQR